MIHKLVHLLRLNRTNYEIWLIRVSTGKKLMCGNRCIKCGQLNNIKPTGLEFEFWK